jgi:hypothetical protein
MNAPERFQTAVGPSGTGGAGRLLPRAIRFILIPVWAAALIASARAVGAASWSDTYRGPLPGFGPRVEKTLAAMPSLARLRFDKGGIVLPDPDKEPAIALASMVARLVRELGQPLYLEHAILDVETPILGGQVLLRAVVGREGRPNLGQEPQGVEDGTSVLGVIESRPAVLLVVVAGRGADGVEACGVGGAGGSAEAFSNSLRGALISSAGDAGSPGPGICEQSAAGGQKAAGDGQPGGDANATSYHCTSVAALAFAGNGGAGTAPSANGGRGGRATADCDPIPSTREKPMPCRAMAVGGNGGHGASGRNDSVAAGGPGGIGARGGLARAVSCCGNGISGNAEAVGGSGGSGGHGGNSIYANGGNGGKALNGGYAKAVVRLGFQDSAALAVAGNGGNGGNGGNSAVGTGGAGGDAGEGRSADAKNECPAAVVPSLMQDGIPGRDGRQGQPPPP